MYNFLQSLIPNFVTFQKVLLLNLYKSKNKIKKNTLKNIILDIKVIIIYNLQSSVRTVNCEL